MIDITGQRFGKLVVIKPLEKRAKNGQVIWECRCDCGKIIHSRGDGLRNGRVKSCGCFSRYKIKNLMGKRFGRLVVIQNTEEKRNRQAVWKCRCDCGNICFITSYNLTGGFTRSCGCLAREIWNSWIWKHGLSRTKEYQNEQGRKRRELKVIQDSFWTLEMNTEIKQFQPFCAFCRAKENLAVDHVLPLSLGYGLKPGNAAVLCQSCNSTKSNKYITELPIEHQAELIWNAFKFKDHWDQKELNESISR